MEEFRIFYSWQSDLPNATNRGFIEKALVNAAKTIKTDASIKVEPVIDRDTAGVPGTPDIASTIFEKIEKSDVFACDVTIVNTDEKTRATPNPNVLIELGYAFKSLGLNRIIMIMNTAFGRPELLPFDLKMKRVIFYQGDPNNHDRTNERNQLSSILETAIKDIIRQIGQTTPRTIPSGDKRALKGECEEVLRHGDIPEWRNLINSLMADIPEHLLKWKERTGQIWEKATPEDREAARFEAVEICLPSFVPIYVAVEQGRKDLWQESVNPFRELALLSNRMRGGFTDVVEIGSHMLYMAGNIGMAIATKSKQLPLINDWMRLPMPTTRYDEPGEIPWLEVYQAHRLWGKYMPSNDAPFEDILKACESNSLSGFIQNHKQFLKFLFLGNLTQSLFEMGRWIENDKLLKELESSSPNKLVFDLNVWPLWGLMTPDDFRANTWTLFDSAEGVRQFVFPGNGISLEKLWSYWKKWKEVCVSALMHPRTPPRMLHAEWLTLPGEPSGR